MKRRDLTAADRAALQRVVKAERRARAEWTERRDALLAMIRRASSHGAGLRPIAAVVGLSAGRIREIRLDEDQFEKARKSQE